MKKLKAAGKERGIEGYDKMSTLRVMRKNGESSTIEAQVNTQDPRPAPPCKIHHTTISRPNITQNPTNILDEPVHEINFPILLPTHPKRNSNVQSLKDLASKVVKPVKQQLSKFADWILSYVPEPIKKETKKKVTELKEKVNRIFNRLERFPPKEKKNGSEGISETLQGRWTERG